MTNEEIQKKDKKEKKNRNTEKDYPYIPLDDAIATAKKIHELGGFASTQELGQALKRKGGWLGITIVSTKRYGLIEGHGKLKLTDLAKKIISPTYEGEDKEGMKEAFMGVKLFAEIYNRFKGKYPEENLFANMLTRNYKVTDKKEAIRIINILKKATQDTLGEAPNLEEEENENGKDNPILQMTNTLPNQKTQHQQNRDKFFINIVSPMGNMVLPIYDKKSLTEFKNTKMKKLLETIEDFWPEEKEKRDDEQKNP